MKPRLHNYLKEVIEEAAMVLYDMNEGCLPVVDRIRLLHKRAEDVPVQSRLSFPLRSGGCGKRGETRV